MRIESLLEFIVVAHYLNFSAAANNLHTSQPNLSKHISEIEQELNVDLFFRGKPLRLTPAGNAFLEDAIQIHHKYKEAVKRCQDVLKKTTEELVIQDSYIVDTLSEIVMKSVMRLRKEKPHFAVKLMNEPGKKSVESLISGKLDIATTVDCNNAEWMTKVSEKKGLLFIPIIEEPLVVWLHRDHPLTKEKVIDLEKIVHYRIVMTATRSFDPIRFAIIDLFTKALNIAPNLQSYPTDTLNEFFMNTNDESAVFLVTPKVAQAPLLQMQQDMISLPIDDPVARITSYFVVTESYSKKSIDAFIDTVEKVINSDIILDERNVYLPEHAINPRMNEKVT